MITEKLVNTVEILFVPAPYLNKKNKSPSIKEGLLKNLHKEY
jgi:hypothetical protein